MEVWEWVLIYFFTIGVSVASGYLLRALMYQHRHEYLGGTICWWDENGFWAARSHVPGPLWHDDHTVHRDNVTNLLYFSVVLLDEDLISLNREGIRGKIGATGDPIGLIVK